MRRIRWEFWAQLPWLPINVYYMTQGKVANALVLGVAVGVLLSMVVSGYWKRAA